MKQSISDRHWETGISHVVVTGNRGYIGSIITPMLLQGGYRVTGVDTDFYRGCDFGAPGERQPSGLRQKIKDVRDIERPDLEGVDAVIHLAALSNDPLGDLDPQITLEINYRATVRLAEIARQAGVRRFLFASSCSNYGAAGEGVVQEEAELRPLTPYGESKVLAERELRKLVTERFSPVFLRCATAYGVSPRLRCDVVLNNLVAWAVTTGRVLLLSDGTPWRPIVHIEDIGRAFLALLEAPTAIVRGEAFNVGTDACNYQIRELAEIVAQVVGDCRVTLSPDAGPDSRCYRVDCTRLLCRVPTYRPQWDARRGAQQLHQAYQRVSFRLEDLEGTRFQRVRRIRKLLEAGKLDESLRWRG